MTIFLAHYKSPNAASERALGQFEFESPARMGSKTNATDARIKMLELYGNDALCWDIYKIERKAQSKVGKNQSDGQLELDFRDPVKKRKRKPKREYW